jgi:hypothetical protein
MAVDFRKPRNPACLAWMRKSLVALEDAGVIEATEEKHPAHFHVAVLRQNPERHIQLAAGDVAPTLAKAAPQKSGKHGAKRSRMTRAQAVASP